MPVIGTVSNTLAPVIARAWLAELELLKEFTRLRDQLEENTRYFREAISKAGFVIAAGEPPIVPVMLGDAALAARFPVLFRLSCLHRFTLQSLDGAQPGTLESGELDPRANQRPLPPSERSHLGRGPQDIRLRHRHVRLMALGHSQQREQF